MSIPEGGFRLHWDEKRRDYRGNSFTYHTYEDFPNINDALDHAAKVYCEGHKLTRLENWLNEDACRPHQLEPAAKIRAGIIQDVQRKVAQADAMTNNPIYGAWG